MNNQMTNQTTKQVNQKVNNNYHPNTGMKKMPKKVQNNPKYTENWLPLKGIKSGIMVNDRNELITGVKIQPKNIFILDTASMDNTLYGLMNFYNTLDYEFWIIVADRPVDITMYQTELQLLFNQTNNPKLRKMITEDLNKADFFINNNVVDNEYFLVFKEKDPELMQKKVRNLINGFASCGLIASQTNDSDMRMIIDNFLNAGRTFKTGGSVVK